MIAEAFKTRQSCRSNGLMGITGGCIGKGHGDEINREVLRGRPAIRSRVHDVALIVAQNRGMTLIGGAQGLGIGIQQILVANNEDALRQSRQMQIGALNALHEQASGSPPQHLGAGKP